MLVKTTKFDNVYTITSTRFVDKRGVFIKTFNKDAFENNGLSVDFSESFYSTSHKNVLRGMHFQLPPFDHDKLVYVTSGKVLDVIVDVRKGSDTYGESSSLILSSVNNKSLYIGKGFVHGYLTISDSATVVYMTSTVHNSDYDTGIRWNSFGFDWNIKSPIVSDRDRDLPNIDELYSL